MIYELAIFISGLIVGAVITLFMGWRAVEEDQKKRRRPPFEGFGGMLLIEITDGGMFALENSHKKGVEEIDKTGLSEKDLEKKR